MFKLRKLLILISFFSFIPTSPSKSAVITVPLNYTVQSGDTGTLSGSFTINTSLDTDNDRDTSLGFTAIPNWITAVTLTYVDAVDASNNFTRSKSAGNITHMIWQVTSGADPDFTSNNLQDDFDGFGFIGDSLTASTGSKLQDTGENEFNLTSTPSPLVALGVIPLILYAKKFKKYSLDQKN